LDQQVASSRGAQLREERRLFYVACTRATRRLVVTAVDPVNEDAEGPSRFFTELRTEFHAEAVPPRVGRPAQALTLRGVIGQLRAVGEHPETTKSDRVAAAR